MASSQVIITRQFSLSLFALLESATAAAAQLEEAPIETDRALSVCSSRGGLLLRAPSSERDTNEAPAGAKIARHDFGSIGGRDSLGWILFEAHIII